MKRMIGLLLLFFSVTVLYYKVGIYRVGSHEIELHIPRKTSPADAAEKEMIQTQVCETGADIAYEMFGDICIPKNELCSAETAMYFYEDVSFENCEDEISTEEETVQSYLYTVSKDMTLEGADGEEISLYEGEIFTGTPDSENENSVILDYQYDTISVCTDDLDIDDDAYVLPTAAIGQMGGEINGIASCGPTAVAILLDWEKQTDTAKDELITYSKDNDLEDQGAIDQPHGGMTAPRLIELADGFYGGDISLENIYDDDPLHIIDENLEAGHRALVAVRYTNRIVTDYPYAGVHFVVICGHADTGDGTIYYYADPYYGDGGHSLMEVSAETLERSMEQVDSEPKTLIVAQ